MSTEPSASPSFVDYNYPLEKLEQAVGRLAHSSDSRRTELRNILLTTPYFKGVHADADAKLPKEIQGKLQQLRELLSGSLEDWDAHKAIDLVCELAFALCREQATLLERQGMPGT